MSLDRRRFLAVAASAGVVGLSGCLEMIQDGVDATAEPAALRSDALEDSDYEFVDAVSYEIDEEIEVGDISRDVSITTWITTYTLPMTDLEMPGEEFEEFEEEGMEFADQEGAGISVVSTPSETAAGQELNPVGRMDDEELIEEFNDEIASDSDVRDIERVDEAEAEVLGETVVVGEFSATVEYDLEDEGTQEGQIRILIAERVHEEDILLLAGVYPEELEAEQENQLELFETVEHPVDPDTLE